MITLPSETTRAEKLAATLEKASREKAELETAIAERNARWLEHLERAEHLQFLARQARGVMDMQTAFVSEHRALVRGTVASGDPHRIFELCSAIAARTAILPEIERVLASFDEEAAPAIEACRKFATENSIPKSVWPSWLTD